MFKRDDAVEEVTRKFRDIAWLHGQFKNDFSGLRIPPLPENNLENIQAFFAELLKIPEIAACYLLLFFVSCTNQEMFDEFVRLRDNAAATGKFELQKALNLDTVTITDTQLKEVKRIAAALPKIAQEPSADFAFFADNVFDFTQIFLTEFQSLGKMLAEIRGLFDELGHKFRRAAESFGMISLQFKKLNFAKTQFPLFEQSNVNLDLVYNRYKLVFYEMGLLTRQRFDNAKQGV